jgi:lipopolysaccharide/colanic/teichoic acid biosynthesis glycosyltransferase
MKNRHAAMGIRISPVGIRPLDALDATYQGTFWYDLRTRRPVASRVKRLLDVTAAAIVLLLFWPLFLVRRTRRVQAYGFRRNRFTMYEWRGWLRWVPQAVNVLNGEMSFVGPSPVTQLHDMTSSGMRRFAVLPGITGLAKVRGAKSEIERGELDRQYVNEWSLRLDARILREAMR